MEPFGGKDYVLVAVDALTKFTQVWSCSKKISGEGAFKIFFEHWLQPFGVPCEVHHDNDVRWVSTTGWWKGALKNLGCSVHLAVPYRPQTNGVCERRNREFLRIMRILKMKTTTRDWMRLIPQAVTFLNSRVSRLHGATPTEIF
jgi:transposase InsO family protein